MIDLIKKIKDFGTGTLVRTILFYLALINEVIAAVGRTSFASAVWYQWVSLIFVVVTAVFTWWYNQDFTSLARLAGKVLDDLQDGKLSKDEVEQLVEEEQLRINDK